MVESGAGPLSEAVLVSCVRAAVAAPSLHNSQPWRFRIHGGGIDVYVDRGRQLDVIDPSGREMLISVGAAVLNLRVAMHGSGRVPVWRAWPGAGQPGLGARGAPGAAARPRP